MYEERVRLNFYNGFVDVAIDNDDQLLTSSSLSQFPTITDKQHAAITLDPRQEFGAAEIAWIVLHTAGEITATILRGQEGSVARPHQMNTRWAHAPTRNDFKSYSTRTFAKSQFR